MRINENILNKFTAIPKEIKEITNNHITEVDNFDLGLNPANIVTGKINKIWKHENADTLSVTLVDVGDGGPDKQIVCGASNIFEGQYVIVALEGAVLPGDFEIKKSKIRGVESNGMIVSLEELGVPKTEIDPKYLGGIYWFEESQELGKNPLPELGLSGFIMELDLTPNRNDLLSHLGFARDLASILKTEVKIPKINLEESAEVNPLTVKIKSKNTNSYLARYIKGVKIAESPLWLKQALLNLDLKPVNNVVDITNYLLFAYGLPMHAFDASLFSNNEIVVTDNKAKIKVETLDDQVIELLGDEVLITNGREPVALGGIMGLKNSMVTFETTDLILEVASFNRDNNFQTSNKLNLKSDSQLRFSRGIDESMMDHVMDHATSLILELAGGKVLKGVSKDIVKVEKNPEVLINLKDINKKLGTNLLEKELLTYLKNLNYQVKKDQDNLKVIAPSYRNDIMIAADVLEEIARMIGLNNIKNEPVASTKIGKLTDKQKRIRQIRKLLANNGLNEIVTYSLLKEKDVQIYNNIGDPVSVLKPISHDRTTLRQSLINGGLEVVNYNKNRNIDNILLFEIGNVFAKGVEDKHLSILLTGQTNSLIWDNKTIKVDFYYLSGILAKLMNELDVKYELKKANHPSYHPYQQAEIIVNKKQVGLMGKIHPKLNKHNVFALELKIDELPMRKPVLFEAISKYPYIERDIAVVLKDDIAVNKLITLIEQTAKKILVDTKVFDVYKGTHIEKGYQSIAVRMTFNDKDKTLESTDVDKVMKKINFRIEKELEGKIRE